MPKEDQMIEVPTSTFLQIVENLEKSKRNYTRTNREDGVEYKDTETDDIVAMSTIDDSNVNIRIKKHKVRKELVQQAIKNAISSKALKP